MQPDPWDPATEALVQETLLEHDPDFWRHLELGWRFGCTCGFRLAGGQPERREVVALAAAHQAREVMVALTQAGAPKESSDVDG